MRVRRSSSIGTAVALLLLLPAGQFGPKPLVCWEQATCVPLLRTQFGSAEILEAPCDDDANEQNDANEAENVRELLRHVVQCIVL